MECERSVECFDFAWIVADSFASLCDGNYLGTIHSLTTKKWSWTMESHTRHYPYSHVDTSVDLFSRYVNLFALFFDWLLFTLFWLPQFFGHFWFDVGCGTENKLQPIYNIIRQKLTITLQAWHPSDESAYLMIRPWKDVWDQQSLDQFMIKFVVSLASSSSLSLKRTLFLHLSSFHYI